MYLIHICRVDCWSCSRWIGVNYYYHSDRSVREKVRYYTVCFSAIVAISIAVSIQGFDYFQCHFIR